MKFFNREVRRALNMCRLVHNHQIVDIYYKGKKKAPQSVLNSKKLTALYVSVIDVGRTISIPFIWMYSTTHKGHEKIHPTI